MYYRENLRKYVLRGGGEGGGGKIQGIILPRVFKKYKICSKHTKSLPIVD